MPNWRQWAIDAGLEFFRASGVHRLAEPFTRGMGAILMFHRVRPRREQDFAPNQGLEITPDFLDRVLSRVTERGFDIVTLDAALARLRTGEGRRPFAVLTFDDGYRDLVQHALPILERRRAPFVSYVTAGFADGSARMWWVELEEAIRRASRLDVALSDGRRLERSLAGPQEKTAAFAELYWRLRAGGEDELLRVAAALATEAHIDTRALTRELCLDWSALRELARHELATIGAHSLTHPRLAKLDGAAAAAEMADSRTRIAAELGVEASHFCYPVGDPTSAGRREFETAARLGFASAVTTRPGMIFPEHRDHLFALPRLSINGRHQSVAALDILLSGAPFALMNRGRRVMAA